VRYLSLFSGIEAASVAWSPLGWECAAVAEVDPKASSLLAYRYPSIPNLGDVSKITDEQIAAFGQLDLVVGGSPCQDLSTAGKRKGLAGARSGLFHEQIRIFHAAKKHCGARFLLWENVFGAFSSNKGKDFGVVVGEMAGLRDVGVPQNGWGSEGCAVGDNGLLEWSTLDAQWFGVPQRRRRIFALLDTGDWADRPPILLEPNSLRGDTPSREKTGKAVAALTSNGVGTCGADDKAQAGHLIPDVITFPGRISETQCAATLNIAADGRDASEDGAGRGTPIVALGLALRGRDGGSQAELGDDLTFTLRASSGGGDKPYALIAFSCKDDGRDAAEEISPTLRAMGFADSHANAGGQVAIAAAIPINDKATRCGSAGYSRPQSDGCGNGLGVGEYGDPMFTLDTAGRHGVFTVAFVENSRGEIRLEGGDGRISGCLNGGGGKPGQGVPSIVQAKQYEVIVRRLTPMECERLQGFPDLWTKIPIKVTKKISAKHFAKYPDLYEQSTDGTWTVFLADGPRYKLLGNSMAVPVMFWIGSSICAALNKKTERWVA